MIAGMSVTAIAMMLVFGAPSFAAMTPTLWALFALGQIGNVKTAIKLEREVIAFMKTPAFRQMLAANGEAAIRWQNRQQEF